MGGARFVQGSMACAHPNLVHSPSPHPPPCFAGVACPSDQQIRHIHDLPTALPWLWAGQQPPLALEEVAAAPVPEEAAAAAEVATASSGTSAALKTAAAAVKSGGRASTEESDQIEAVFAAA